MSTSSVYTIGEILVEIIAKDLNQGFLQAGIWQGPFPSGAPAIFIDQVAKMGQASGIISCVGKDDFGKLNTDRLAEDGVNIEQIYILEGENTGSAFVSYKSDGDRDFLFNIKNSATGKIVSDLITEDSLKHCQHLHVMGSSLFSFNMIDTIKKAADIVKANGGSISFDPNIRKEMLHIQEMTDSLLYMLELTDTYMPSEDEVCLLSKYDTHDNAIKQYLEMGIKEVVIKRGNKGARYISSTEDISVNPIKVTEIDPTGAGDCFGGAFIAARQMGKDIATALNYANIAGALSVTKLGPMEGTSTLAEIEAIYTQNTSSF